MLLLKSLITIVLMLYHSELRSEHTHDAAFDEREYMVYVVQSRWHTGIILHTNDVDSLIWPEIAAYTHREYIDIGWGDEKFYQTQHNLVPLALRAALWPTSSVLQIYAFNLPLRRSYGEKARILKIPIDRQSLDHLTKFLSGSYKRDANGNVQTSNLYGETSLYFRANRNYHLFRTCNTWVAKGFKVAGYDIRSFCILNANQLFRQLRKIEGAEFE